MVLMQLQLKDGDELLEAKLTNGNSQIMLAVKSGKAIRFEEGKLDQWEEMPQELEE